MGLYLRIIESKKRPETENNEILDALNIDNISKLKQISPYLGGMDLAQSDDSLVLINESFLNQEINTDYRNKSKLILYPEFNSESPS